MNFNVVYPPARAAWAAATTQQAQLEALRDEWSGQVSVRYYSAADAHLATVTHDTPIVDTTTTPRSLRLGAWVAESHVQDGTAAYCILAVPAGADILRADVSLAGAISDPGGRVRVDIGTKLRLDATASLPVGAEPGTVTTIGTQSLYDYLGDVRTALPEGLAAADARMKEASTLLAYCGASTIWRSKFAFPIAGGHGDGWDDGGYAQDLITGAWETMILPSTHGSSVATSDSYGEWTGGISGRPASQHTLQQLVTVGDDIIQGNGSYIATAANGSRQAHRWNYSTGLWQRYGTLTGRISNLGSFVHYDAGRNRVVRISLQGVYGYVDTIPADNAAADWTEVTIASGGRVDAADIGCSMGYHEALDCYVLISPGEFTPRNRIYVMDPDTMSSTGWVSVSVSGDVPAAKGNTGLEYCPPKQCMVTVDATVNDKLYYITPTGAATDPWVWSSETFTGAAIEAWEGNGGGNYNGVYRRFVWSSALGGFVMLKKATALTELYVPTVP